MSKFIDRPSIHELRTAHTLEDQCQAFAMCRPHFRIPRIDAQHAHASAFANNGIDGQENLANANAAEERQIRMSRIRRNIANGTYLTREAAEKSANRLMESGDL